MSIIQEALKKVQKYPGRSDGDHQAPEQDEPKITYADDPYSVIERGFPDKKYFTEPQKLFLPVIIAIIFAATLFYALKHIPSQTKSGEALKKANAALVKKSDVKTGKPVVEDKSNERMVETSYVPANISPARSQDPIFVLNGIMLLETGSRAIINGSVVEKGDKISGATVEVIEREKVTLRYDDEKITLRLK